jgi:hypothetical protein
VLPEESGDPISRRSVRVFGVFRGLETGAGLTANHANHTKENRRAQIACRVERSDLREFPNFRMSAFQLFRF